MSFLLKIAVRLQMLQIYENLMYIWKNWIAKRDSYGLHEIIFSIKMPNTESSKSSIGEKISIQVKQMLKERKLCCLKNSYYKNILNIRMSPKNFFGVKKWAS